MTSSSAFWLRGCRAGLSAGLLAASLTAAAQNPTPAPSPAASSALRYVQAHATAWGLTAADVQDAAVQSAYTDAHNGVTHAYLRQRLDGKDILGTEVGVHLDRSGQLLTRTGQFVANASAARRPTAPSLPAQAAQQAAERRLPQTMPAAQQAASADAPQLAYLRQPDGTLKLVWQVVVEAGRTPDVWDVLVDAETGNVLNHSSRTHREQVAPPASSARPAEKLAGARTTAQNAYRVFPAPVESPDHGPRAVASNPADALTSPFGWHDTDGTAGAEHTITRGNNAYVYIASRTGAPVYSPDGGTDLTFDFALDLTRSAAANRDAALTNAFYWVNLMHDVSARYGFTEAAGNFQATNYSGQGLGGDAINVWAQDPDSEGNASYQATPDGPHPTAPNAQKNIPLINLGLYNQEISTTLSVTSGGVPVVYPILENSRSRAVRFPIGTPVTARLVVVNTLGGVGATSACNGTFANAAQLVDNIAVVDVLDCPLEDKVLNVQAAGARAVLFLTPSPGPHRSPLVENAAVRIPCAQLSYQDSQTLRAQLQSGLQLTGTALATQPLARDVAFDNGVVAHEFMHGVSVRLTGGPANIKCLDNKEQMGEGWSDFLALWATTRPTDRGQTARPASTYPIGQPITGPGIRYRYYSTDMSVNTSTYAEVGRTVYTAHPIGFVWCSALWDLNWALIQRYGYDANLPTGTGGNNKAMQLVIDGLKLQPCSPGFLDGRDAILAADRATFGGQHQALIWQVFARRGMGVDAVQGSSDSLSDNTAGFQVPGALATARALDAAALEVYPNPARGSFTLRFTQAHAHPVQVELVSVLGQRMRAQTIPAAQAAAGARLNLSGLAQGVYVVRLTTPVGTLTRRLVVQQ